MNVSRRGSVLIGAGACIAGVALATAPSAAADPGGPCIQNAGGIVSVDGADPVPAVFGFDGARLLGVEGGTGNACITNVGPGAVSVSHPEGRVPGRNDVSTAFVEMRVDGGVGNVAVTNVGTGAVAVDRRSVTEEPVAPEQVQPEPGMPEISVDAGTDGVFVTNVGTGVVTVTDGDPGPLPPPIPPAPGAVVTDPVTGNVYVTNLFGPDITVVDPPAGTGQSVVDRSVPGTTVDYGTGNVFVTNIGGGRVTVVR
ncbi:hypothetical protein [Rhodococcus coprophilus]|uniref:hypothetical protein n=1 Tax=Rhodococcus coprophilus TaxID=38310 RepID=UPI000932A247|nr:hypothetical protein [Rhodococcus coprophilus]MBM7458762.1 hypothetical protein [Rhodococcus coprophilus]